jgi:hypothetical protein
MPKAERAVPRDCPGTPDETAATAAPLARVV